jgi:AraC-like DNA-binding protein
MVCDRCKMVVRAELIKLGFNPITVNLGNVELENDLNAEDKLKIDFHLKQYGFELLEDKKEQLVEQIKTTIVSLFYKDSLLLKDNLSTYLSNNLNVDYSSLSAVFSERENQTIENYFITQKVEKTKELIGYDELNMSEIAFKLNYSSVAHLSTQFKKVTGITPSEFKKLIG